jgi:hypothetical protein
LIDPHVLEFFPRRFDFPLQARLLRFELPHDLRQPRHLATRLLDVRTQRAQFALEPDLLA